MLRCPSCGVRVSSRTPRCPEHGDVPVPAEPVKEEPKGEESTAASEDAASLSLERLSFPGYAVTRELGRGGFGVVVQATREADGREAAIKVALGSSVLATEGLVREVALLRRVGPPNVPEVLEAGITGDGAHYAVLEFVRAKTLADALEERSCAVPAAWFDEVAPQLVVCLGALHRAQIVHCDLKPENVFLRERDGKQEVMLFDLGASQDLSLAYPMADDEILGTPEYMAPEQCEGRSEVDVRSDLYATGVLLYEMLTGAPPFFGNDAEVKESHRSRRPAHIAGRGSATRELDEVVLRCLAKAKSKRFDTTDALGEALAAAIAARRQGEAASPDDTQTRGRKSAKDDKGREKRTVGLVWFESPRDLGSIQGRVEEVRGTIAHAKGVQYVVVFGQEAGDNPARAALVAAREFVRVGVCERAIVDLASVAFARRPDGTERILGTMFAKADRYPNAKQPLGPLVTLAAARVLSDLDAEPVNGFPELLALRATAEDAELTVVKRAEQAFVGHEGLRKELRVGLRRAREGLPTIVTILADAGYGKSHLASIVAQDFLEEGCAVLALRAPEPMGDAAHAALRELVSRLLSLPRSDPGPELPSLLGAILGDDLAAEVRGGICIAMGWTHPDPAEYEALKAAPGALRQAAAKSVGVVLRAKARQEPVAVLLDDAQFADPTLLDAFEYATLSEAKTPIWIGLLARPGFTSGRTAWGSRAGHHLRRELAPLDETEASELARILLVPATNVPVRAIRKLCARTQGIPLLLVELVRGLKRDGIVRKREHGTGWLFDIEALDQLPDLPLVQWLAARELDALPEQDKAYAELASMLGPSFVVEDVEDVMRAIELGGGEVGTDLDAEVGIRRLITAGLLARHRTGTIAFRHALLRQTIYGKIGADARTRGHHAAYTVYESRHQNDGSCLDEVAYHAMQAGLQDRAAEAYLELAARATERHGYVETVELYKQALTNLGDEATERRISATLGRGLARFRLGHHSDSFSDLASALEMAEAFGSPGTRVRILLDGATVLDWLEQYDRSQEFVEKAASVAGSDPGPLVEARICLGRGRSAMRHSDFPAAREPLTRARELASGLGNEGYETSVISQLLLGPLLTLNEEIEAAEVLFRELIALCDEHGDQLHLAVAHLNRIFLWFSVGRTDQVLADQERVIAISRETGFPKLEAITTYAMGEVSYLVGDYEKAAEHARRSSALSEEMEGVGRPVLSGCLLLARSSLLGGRVADAKQMVQKIRQIQSRGQAEGHVDLDFPPSDQVLFDMVELALSHADDASWAGLLERSRVASVQQEPIEVLEVRGIAALREGRPEVAVEYLEQALALTKTIPNVMVNRVTQELAQARTALEAAHLRTVA